MYPWNWVDRLPRVTFSPRSSSASSQEADSLEGDSPCVKGDNNKRGRPRAEKISSLIFEGALSTNNIRCKICSRVFPREKSLQAHMRTHTGERPYVCDYPGCGKSFCQSGQLKTHQRLHTGEKPFICSVEGCTSRFTHANRHCSDHPFASLRRLPNHTLLQDRLSLLRSSTNHGVTEWLARHCLPGEDNCVAPTQPEKKIKRENSIAPPATPVVHVHQIEVAPKMQSIENTPPTTVSVSPSDIPSHQPMECLPSIKKSEPTVTLPISSSTLSSAFTPTEKTTKLTSRPVLNHRPFKKEATDKWVSALALLELAQGVS